MAGKDTEDLHVAFQASLKALIIKIKIKIITYMHMNVPKYKTKKLTKS
jgi:hypothetical protein